MPTWAGTVLGLVDNKGNKADYETGFIRRNLSKHGYKSEKLNLPRHVGHAIAKKNKKREREQGRLANNFYLRKVSGYQINK